MALSPPEAQSANPEARGESQVERVRLSAAIALESGTSRVTIEYRLRLEGASEVPLVALGIAGARVEALTVSTRGGAPRVAVRPGPAGRQAVSLSFSEDPGADPVELRLEYQVAGGVAETRAGWELTLPVMAAEWKAPRGAEETFVATVDLEPGGEVFRSFPASFAGITSPSPDRTRYTAALPVVPAVLRLSVARDRAPLLTLERTADGALLLLLGGLTVVGWRRFRELLA